MTPYQISVLTDISSSPPAPDDGNNRYTTNVLKEDGLIRLDEENRFVVTAKGEAHIRQLCLLPLPKEAWVDDNGKLL